jgi:hypothetical protein
MRRGMHADQHHDGLCLRCVRPLPDVESPELWRWSVALDDAGEFAGVICPGCRTGTELRAIVQGEGSRSGS